MTDEIPVLAARDLRVELGGLTILRHVTLDIGRGECVGLLGPNGAGKSTLLRSLSGLTRITDGQILLSGKPTIGWPAAMRRRVGMIFQKHQLVPRATALTNVVHGGLGLPQGWRCCWQVTAPSTARQQAVKCLDEVGLVHKANQRVDTLSGGEAQRVAIARILMREPDVILADEPTASLDPAAGGEILQRLRSLNRDLGVTLLIAIHNLPQLLEFTDRVIGLRNGELMLDEPTGTLTEGRLQAWFQPDRDNN